MSFRQQQSGPRTLHLHCEQSPLALSRVHALLALLNLVPDRSLSEKEGELALWITLEFDALADRQFDLLQRKAAQLTETLSLSETQGFDKQKQVAC